jgi:hypothetical protein
MAELTHDLGFTGKLDIGGNPRPLLITHITGKQESKGYFDTFWTWRKDKGLKEKYLSKETDGIYVKNGGDENLNIGDTDCHFYSTTDLTTGRWQNPWSGVEEVNLGHDLCVSGSLHSYSSNLKMLLGE